MHDGEGLRTVVFLKGCALSCQWCSTPESQRSGTERGYHAEKCVLCGECVRICPGDALALEGDQIKYKEEHCKKCFCCVDICLEDAVCSYGQQMSVDQVFAEVVKDEVFYFHSEGGVTISGGECLLQADFVADILQLCRSHAIHTAIETSLHGPWQSIVKILPYLSTIYIDLKHPENREHRKLTGVGNALILSNLKRLETERADLPIHIRIPLIPGVNDSDDSLKQAATVIAQYQNVADVELLPYHRLGVVTYSKLQRQYGLCDVQAPTTEYVAQRCDFFRSCIDGIQVTAPSRTS